MVMRVAAQEAPTKAGAMAGWFSWQVVLPEPCWPHPTMPPSLLWAAANWSQWVCSAAWMPWTAVGPMHWGQPATVHMGKGAGPPKTGCARAVLVSNGAHTATAMAMARASRAQQPTIRTHSLNI